MKDLDTIGYHPKSEQLVKVLCNKTHNQTPEFFRVLVAYYFAKVASMQRVKIKTMDRGTIPVNVYAMNLATSGFGKGHSTNIVEDQVINQFRERFLDETFPLVSESNLAKIALKRSIKKQTDQDEELERVTKEFSNLGTLAFSFDSATPAAVKQMRHKLLMANAGSVNMEIDEIGSNLLGQTDVLNVFLELYDVGKVKPKLVKNTTENVRNEDIEGKTPTNLMLYGTPQKLLDGGKTEEAYMSFLETGYGRRCIFGYSRDVTKDTTMTPSEFYDLQTDPSTDAFLQKLSDDLGNLADPINFNLTLSMDKAVTILLIEYRMWCEKVAAELADHEEIRKAEISHRYFKTLKLAGAYAFIDGSPDILEEHIYNAIKLVEESGEALKRILTRERNYVKLARYVAEVQREVTHVDLTEDLPFYKGAAQAKAELLTLAIAWGYKNNIIIKKMFNDGIEFLKGESLQVTDQKAMYVSYGTHMAYNYLSEEVPFDQMHKLTQAAQVQWVNHKLIDGTSGKGHRMEENCIPGFNMVVIDVDNGCSLDTAKLLLKGYKCLFYTTKRHRVEGNGDRFRIIMPMNYTLKMDAHEYKEFMANVFEWLPFKVDDQTNQRARKWMSHDGHHEYIDGEPLDALLFIPKTTKNEERKKVINDQQSLSNIERWFINNTGVGNRSNQMIKYALLLVDAGKDFDEVQGAVLSLNSKIQDKMDEVEVRTTIMVSVANAITKRHRS